MLVKHARRVGDAEGEPRHEAEGDELEGLELEDVIDELVLVAPIYAEVHQAEAQDGAAVHGQEPKCVQAEGGRVLQRLEEVAVGGV